MKLYKQSTILAAMFLMIYSILSSILSLYMFYCKGMIMLEFHFFEINSTSFSLSILLDWVSFSFSGVVCFISSCVMIFSQSYMSSDSFIKRFIWIVMFFVLSMNILIYIPNMVALLLGWDGLGLVSFCLVIYYQNPKSLSAGMMTALMNRVGDVAILLSIGWTLTYGSWNCFFMSSYNNSYLVVMMLLLAGMTKSAQLPFCSWLPAAMAAPTPVSALVHSSTLVTAGVYLLIRFFPFLDHCYFFAPSLMVVSTMTMFMAGVAASYEMDLKKIIALSTLSQLGVMMFSLSLKIPLLALLHLFTHALFKALLFLCAGSIIHNHNNNQDIRKMGQLWDQMPVSSSCLNVANLALCGFPFLAGFYSKDLIIEMMILNSMNLLIGLLVLMATMMTAGYSMRLSLSIFWSGMNQDSKKAIEDEDKFVLLPIFLLTIGAISSGAYFSWMVSPSVFPLLNMSDKTSALVVTLVGGIMMFLISNNTMNKQQSFFMYLSSYMWFMTSLSNNFVSMAFMSSAWQSFKYLDLGWLENFSGEGMFQLILVLTQQNQHNQGNIFTSLVSLIFLSMLIIPSSMLLL